ncbi:TonB-dependent receptor domain-containing protein [Proteus hauseri]|uniref:TonB-dependent receptor domain-containing protein n=1 Tax=Proteus hauseri TaxID=183417 RepID=UPI0010094364|nr:TonB-dependent receptor [Proteus hauseri]QAV24447.1 hemin receptor [Proteus hauseri]
MDIYSMCMLKKHFKFTGIATAFCLLYTPITFAHITQLKNSDKDTLTVISSTQDKNHEFHSTIDTISAKAQTASTTGEMLKEVAGVTLSGTGVTNGANLLIRGYDQKGVKIIVDGIQQPLENTMNNLGGVFIDPALIRRVKVKHGSSAVLDGEGAMGGVVSFQTIDPRSLLTQDKNLSAKLFTSVSSADKHFTYGGIIAARHDIAEGLIAYSQRQRGPIRLADGEKMANHEHVKNVFAKTYLYPTENQTFIFSARYYDNHGEQREVLHRMGGYGKNDSNQVIRHTQQKNYAITHHYAPETNSWLDLTTHLYYSQFDINQLFLTDTSLTENQLKNNEMGKMGVDENRTQMTYGLKLENQAYADYLNIIKHSFIVGTETYQQKMTSNEKAKNFPLAQMNYAAGWLQNTLSTPLLPLSLTAGIRYHYYQNNPHEELNSFFNKFESDQLIASKHKASYQGTSENVKVTFSPTDWLQLYTSYSTAFRAPTLSEMFNDSLHFKMRMGFFGTTSAHWVPNPNLKPEKNRTWEYGGQLVFQELLTKQDKLSINAAYFDTDSKDYITYGPWHEKSLAGMLNLQAFNIPKALIDGIDISLRYTHPYFSMGLNYNRTKTLELTTHETISPVRPEILTTFISIPVIKTPFTLTWSGQFASATDNKGTHKGRAPHVKGKTTNRMQELIQQYPGYGIHDFSISYLSQKNKNIQAALVLANAFNYEYFSAMGVPKEGRNIKMSVSYHW